MISWVHPVVGSGGAGCWLPWLVFDDCFVNGAVFRLLLAEYLLVSSVLLWCRPGPPFRRVCGEVLGFLWPAGRGFLGRPALSTQPAGAQGWTLADKKSDVFELYFLIGIFVEFLGVEDLVWGAGEPLLYRLGVAHRAADAVAV